MSELFEKLAEIEHDRWSSWQKYMHSLCVKSDTGQMIIPRDRWDHWEQQIVTQYSDLSEHEKEMDRDQVRKYWHLIPEPPKE